jgi:hypothetical protein
MCEIIIVISCMAAPAAAMASPRNRGRERIGEPDVPALRPVRRGEFLVPFHVHIGIEAAHGNGIAELGADARNARLEAADPIS